MTILGRLTQLALLAGLGYLGFYVYGLVMGVFSPVEMLGFTIAAVVAAAAFGVHMFHVARAMRTPGVQDEIMREAHVHRERRGF